ncbi:MAG: hypothetical protein J4G00_02965 [Actinomycetia bacterium]|nr:hypothetical protein [Actinomycetes bacterium]
MQNTSGSPSRSLSPREVSKSELTNLLVKAYKEWAEGEDWAHLPAGLLARDITATGSTDRPY